MADRSWVRWQRAALFSLFGADGTAAALSVGHVHLPLVRPVLGLVLVLVTPILLAYRLLAPLEVLARMACSIAVSVLAVMVGGLAVNAVLPLLGDTRPLSPVPLVLAAALPVVGLARAVPLPACGGPVAPRRIARLSKVEAWSCALAVLAVALAVGGATRMNNGRGPALSEVALTVVLVLFCVLLLRVRRMRPAVIGASLCGAALALLLLTSLRGWYVTGHDIQYEYGLFSQTHTLARWLPSSPKSSYEACISITVLPQVIQVLTGLDAAYVWKVVFQMLFATAVLPIYLVGQRLAGRRAGVLAAVLFMTLPTFVYDMSFLGRQEIAFIFVGSLILAATSCGWPSRLRRPVLGACATGCVISHYSTTYYLIGTLVGTFLVRVAMSLFATRGQVGAASWRQRYQARIGSTGSLGPGFIAALLVLAGLWNGVITVGSGQLESTLSDIVGTVSSGSLSGRSSNTSLSIVPLGGVGHLATTAEFYDEELAGRTGGGYLPASDFPVSSIVAVKPPTVAPTALGRALDRVGIAPGGLNDVIRQLCARLIQLLAIGGTALVVVGSLRRRAQSLELAALGIGCLLALAATVVIPSLTVSYGLFRAFQQSAFVLAPLAALAAVRGGAVLTRRSGEMAASAVVVAQASSLIGLMPQLTGGYTAQIDLNSTGDYYAKYYTTPEEVAAAQWLDHAHGRAPVQTDPYTTSRLQSEITSPVINDDFPVVLRRDALVLFGSVTVRTGLDYAGPLAYTYPFGELTKDKHVVYTSDGAVVGY